MGLFNFFVTNRVFFSQVCMREREREMGYFTFEFVGLVVTVS